MKSILKILTIAGVMIMATLACDEYVDIAPENSIQTEEFFINEEDAVQSVNAIYAHMRAWPMVAFAYIIMQEISSDNAVKGSAQGDASFINEYDAFTYTPNQFVLNDYWNGRYRGINLANQAISNIPPIEMDESLKARLIGEAKFARAMFYFDLVRAFGAVPTPTSIENAQEASFIRTPEAEVYDLIISDLMDAIAVLPESYGASNVGRATVWSARGLLSKVYLYREQYQQALEQTNAIISSGQFGLIENFYEVFRIENENSIESIFEVQASAVPGQGDLSNSQYSQVQGVRGPNGFGWGFNIPSSDLVAAFDAAGDEERKDATILFRGEVTPDGDLIEGVEPGQLEGVDQPRYNGKSYVPRDQQVAGVNEGAEQNIRVLRFAEILLIDAEAELQTGDASAAAESLNAVRERVGLDPIAAPTIEDIWLERRLELAMEGDRFFDLVRTGQAAAELGPLGFTPGVNEVYPIPQTIIDITDGALEQNPGY